MASASKIVIVLFVSIVNLLVVTHCDAADACAVCRCVVESRLLDCDNLWMQDEDLVAIATSVPKNTSSLSFSGNRFTEFPPRGAVFRRMTEVRSLNLSRNVLESIPENLQETFPLLEVLDISANRIGVSDGRFSENPDIFEKVSSLRELHLRDNLIKRVNASVFKSLSGLTHLDLSLNLLEDLPQGFFRYFTSGGTTVRLGENAITRIGEFLFSANQTFKQILLNRNKISSLHENAFDDVIIDDLSLDFNALSVLPMSIASSVTKNVSVSGNPLRCDCQLYKLFRSITAPTSVINATTIRLEGAQCAAPFVLRGFGFRDFAEIADSMCPVCNATECSLKYGTGESRCYTCECANREQRGTCIRENMIIEPCNCTSYTHTFADVARFTSTVTPTKSGLSTYSWILIGVIGFTVVVFLLVSLPVHYYCRRRIHKRHLRRLSIRKRLLSKSSKNSSNNSDDTDVAGTSAGTSDSDVNRQKTLSLPTDAATKKGSKNDDDDQVFEIKV